MAEGNFEGLTLSAQLRVIGRAAAAGNVSLIGSSMGGYLAALYAARHADVERVVLLAPAFGFARRWTEHLGPAAIEAWRHSGAMDVFHYGQGRNCALGYQLMEDAAQYEDYPDVRQPCLIFHGIHDDVVPVRYSEEFASRPNVELHAVDSDTSCWTSSMRWAIAWRLSSTAGEAARGSYRLLRVISGLRSH